MIAGVPTPTEPARVAAVRYRRGQDIDRLLLEVVATLRSRRLSLGGLVQVTSGGKGQLATAVHLLDIATAETFDVWEDRGPGARSCRLDEGGLARAEQAVERTIDQRVDLLLLNRFGRAESQGRGLSRCFAAALDTGMAVLTCVREPYDASWRAFHGGLGVELDADVDGILRWVQSVVPATAGDAPRPLSVRR
jgi:hypothetical protein